MEKLNAIGFHNYWSVVPAFPLKVEPDSTSLFLDNNDIANLLLTIYFNQSDNCLFTFNESQKENIARCLFFFELFNDTSLSVIERSEIFLEVYGNTFLSARTGDYLIEKSNELINFVTSDKRYSGELGNIFDISALTYKDIDDLVDIFRANLPDAEFDVEKYRNDRLRFHYKERYDYRNNLIDYDYHFCLKERVEL